MSFLKANLGERLITSKKN